MTQQLQPRYEPTINLGNILQIVALLISVVGAVWWLSARQEDIVEQNRELGQEYQQQAQEIRELQDISVRRDVLTEHDKLVDQRFDQVLAQLNAISRKVGLPSQEWRRWDDGQPH